MSKENCPAKNCASVENLFSAWDEPEDRNESFQCRNDIVDFPYIVNYLKAFTESMFTHLEYFDPAVQSMLESSTPYVSVMSNAESADTDKLPSVIIEFSGAEVKQDFGFDACMSYNLKNSTGTYLSRWNSAYSIHVIARNRYEAFLLGTGLARCFVSAKKLFKDVLHLITCQVSSVGKATPRSESSPNLGYIVPITLSMTSEEIRDVIEIAPVLKKVVATTNL